jgi:hypothetical protein
MTATADAVEFFIDSSALNNLSNAEKSVQESSQVFDISKVLKSISKKTEDIIFGEKSNIIQDLNQT